MLMYEICLQRSLVSNDMLDCHPLHCLQLIVPLKLALEASVSVSHIQVPCICYRKLQLPVESLDSTEADKIITKSASFIQNTRDLKIASIAILQFGKIDILSIV